MAEVKAEEGYAELVQGKFRDVTIANIDTIGQALVQRACEGHYNAAHLLLDLAGLGPASARKNDTGRSKMPAMFVLELADRIFKAEK